MKRSDSFSISRLGMLFKQDYIENYRQLFLSSGFIALLLSVIYILICSNSRYYADDSAFNLNMKHYSIGWLLAVFIISGMIAGSSMFSSMRRSAGRLSSLMVPASQFEKFIERWIVAVPGYIIVFAIAAFVADLIRIGFCEWILERSTTAITLNDIFDGIYPLPKKIATALLLFMFAQSFFVLGSIVWQKLAVVKTFWVLVAIGAFYAAVAGWIMYTFQNPELTYRSAGSMFDNDALIYTGIAVATLFNYGTAYMRFRESEIINRW
ncbi:MAG: hypothetical protein NC421_11430 [Lachnospiraceae bacterium]|nr:hypothetical protein [Lachnospiraceae bacterium]